MRCDCPLCSKELGELVIDILKKEFPKPDEKVNDFLARHFPNPFGSAPIDSPRFRKLTEAEQLEEEVSHEVDGEDLIAQLADHYQLPYYIARAISLLCSCDKEDAEEACLFIQMEMDKQ